MLDAFIIQKLIELEKTKKENNNQPRVYIELPLEEIKKEKEVEKPYAPVVIDI